MVPHSFCRRQASAQVHLLQCAVRQRHGSSIYAGAKAVLAILALGWMANLCCAAGPAIIPLPQTLQIRPGYFSLCPNQPLLGVPARPTRIIYTDRPSVKTAQYLAQMLFRSTGYRFAVVTINTVWLVPGPVPGALLLTTVNAAASLGPEGYELTVAPDYVVIRAAQQAGVFYGVQSFLQLFPPQILSLHPVRGVAWTAPCVFIQDQPRFVWRGLMLCIEILSWIS